MAKLRKYETPGEDNHIFVACVDNAVICQDCGGHQGNHVSVLRLKWKGWLILAELLQSAEEYCEWNESEYQRNPRISERFKAAIRAAGGKAR